MKFEDIAKANESIKTTDIKGKDYAEVNQRIKVFRMLDPNGSILTDIKKLEDGLVVIKATVLDEEEHVIGTGHAYEKESSSFINKTSYIENCETSAVGRALGMLGIGIDTSIASYEEVSNAIKQQEEQETQKVEKTVIDNVKVKSLEQRCKNENMDIKKIIEHFKVTSLKELTEKQLSILNQYWESFKEA